MNKLIFNEKTYIENVLNTYDKNIDITLFQLTQSIAIYYYQEYNISNKEQLEKCVNSELERFEFDNYYYEAYYKTIRKIVQNVIRYDLKLKEA